KVRCECNGRAWYCLQDASGLRCVDCRGNTEGRHCKRCKDGFYQQGAGLSCTPCSCNLTGERSPVCVTSSCLQNSLKVFSLQVRSGIFVTAGGAAAARKVSPETNVSAAPMDRSGRTAADREFIFQSQRSCSWFTSDILLVVFRRQEREDSGSLTLPCFCYGHSEQCSAQPGYSIYNISSTFSTGNATPSKSPHRDKYIWVYQVVLTCCVSGPEGWTMGTVQGMTPQDVLFRWTPKHQDLEVISKQSLPAYLQAPGETSSSSPGCFTVSSSYLLTRCFLSCRADVYLGNKLLSYGQNFSFSLRLDRGIRYPSTNDVILEGAGLRVAASLGDLRSIVPCGKKISYTFRSETCFSLCE
ncbi:hypothetical protein XENOCAPTIV_008856, partial [Xenoophorus captivus]